MNDEIISTLLEWNPWFENGRIDQLVGVKREYDLFGYLAVPEIKILEGIRRAGKSTLLYQIAAEGLNRKKQILYINFDDEILKKYTLSDIYYAFLQKSKIDYLLLDEIQHCKDWVPFIRKFYDRKELDQIWITGSNSSLIKKDYAELLTGRNLKLTITPLTFNEFLSFKKIETTSAHFTRNKEAEIKILFQEYLNFGAFPAIALRSVFQRELLNNYFDDFLYKDIGSRYEVNMTKLKDLAIYLATNSAKLFSYRNVATHLMIHVNTLTDYISYLKDIFLFDEIYKFDYSLKNQYSNDKKIYIIDTGLANSISFRFSEDKGRLLETAVYQMLKRLPGDIYFHRGKKECDFVIKQNLEIVEAIQVTTSLEEPKTKEREFAGLIDALRTFNLKKGLILTLEEEEQFEITDGNTTYQICVQPVWKWLMKRL